MAFPSVPVRIVDTDHSAERAPPKRFLQECPRAYLWRVIAVMQ
jgi:hypothetical protein